MITKHKLNAVDDHLNKLHSLIQVYKAAEGRWKKDAMEDQYVLRAAWRDDFINAYKRMDRQIKLILQIEEET